MTLPLWGDVLPIVQRTGADEKLWRLIIAAR